jgi:hypothetical protein
VHHWNEWMIKKSSQEKNQVTHRPIVSSPR